MSAGGDAGPRTVSFATLGCKLNQYETNDLERRFADAGWRVVPFGETATVTVVNTCTVTGKSDRRCRAAVRAARRASPAGTVVAAGCYAQAQPGALAALPEVDLVLGNAAKPHLLAHLDSDGRRRGERVTVPPVARGPAAAFTPIRAFAGHTRAFVKIQDGCDAHCAYCIVPQARGPNRSLPAGDVVRQVGTLAAAGYGEVVLAGVHLGTWGRDLSPAGSLAGLVRALAAIQGLERLRLSSIEPAEFSEELLEALGATPKVCPHLHVPLQSGSAAVLRRMGRPYGPAGYARLVGRLAELIPDVAIGADVIAGHPGEGPAEFEEGLSFVEALPLAYLHVFPYSPRPGTPAAAMPDQVGPGERERRALTLRALGRAKADEYHARHVGRTMRALLERRPDKATGLTPALTGNYLKVLVDAPEGERGAFRDVRVLRHEGGRLHGELA